MTATRVRYLSLLLGIAVLFCCASSAAAENKANACVTCHATLGGDLARPVADWRSSIHHQNGITCELCHGGDANVEVGDVSRLGGADFMAVASRAMTQVPGFVGKPTGQAMFDMCALCHGASVARYAQSLMGVAYLEKHGGPSCTTCHQAHDNIIPAVPQSCGQCHQDTTGFDQIDPMNVTAATVSELAGIRIRQAGAKVSGSRPALAPVISGEPDSYLIGLLAFGAVLVLLFLGYLVSVLLERRR